MPATASRTMAAIPLAFPVAVAVFASATICAAILPATSGAANDVPLQTAKPSWKSSMSSVSRRR